MKKNLFSMLVISVLALAFVGCANSGGGEKAVTLQSMQLETSF